MEQINKILTNQQLIEQPISEIVLNLILCMLLLSLISWYYKKFSQSLGGKTHVGSILPLIGLTVFLVIVVVKSSLALSLGLVGALSIVRFRTPIKEPEELGYLFLTIAVGLGFGAGYEIITIIITISILTFLYFTSTKQNSNDTNGEYTILINVSDNHYKECTKLVEKKTTAFKITRVESGENRITVYYNISINNNFDFQSLIKDLKLLDKDSKIDFVEAGVNW
jgi:uncharacterized membrane protein YhiD involved in acid resistance|tara:strand:- start:229 stop:900 length:672 start_codon:yes stop_codon:yes gene_type:complete